MPSIIFNGGVRKQRRSLRDADAARDAKKYFKAALLYEKALRLAPDDAAIHIQCGHMFKEAGTSPEPSATTAKRRSSRRMTPTSRCSWGISIKLLAGHWRRNSLIGER